MKMAVVAGLAAAAMIASDPGRPLSQAREVLGARARPELPDRASIEEHSPYYSNFGGHKVGVRFEGAVRPNDVAEYCVSEGWIRLVTRINGTLKRERGRLVTVKKTGKVEPFYL